MKNRMLMFVLPVLSYFALLSGAQAVSPPPDGGYAGGNTAEGQNALLSLTTGTYNTAIGSFTLESIRANNFSTAVGAGALLANTGGQNTAVGAGALLSNTSGFNTAVGAFALFSNTDGSDNTAVGLDALEENITGLANVAIGYFALETNISGNNNTAIGYGALGASAASSNTAVGFDALELSTGSLNTAIGESALGSNTTGASNTAIGVAAGSNQTTGSNNVYIGAGINGVAGESNACRIASIFGQTATSGSAVFITSANKLGTDTSSKRFKEDIKPMEKASEALLALKPVTFRYKKDIDPEAKSQFGLVAEDVEKVNPDLIVRDKEGKPYSVRYDQVNAMLLNEFLKEHRTVQEQGATIARLEKQIELLGTGLQKVNAQLELNKRTPETVSNSR
jgi:hypothetical protein